MRPLRKAVAIKHNFLTITKDKHENSTTDRSDCNMGSLNDASTVDENFRT